jgi:Sec-independent protein translocase protein TatA
MGNFSLGQLIILILLILLAFGDFSKLTKSLKHFLNKHQFINTEKKNRKKGS